MCIKLWSDFLEFFFDCFVIQNKKMEKYQSLPQIPQRTPEWYKKKETILTSTQIASILHLNSYHSYDQLLNAPLEIQVQEPMKVTRENCSQIDPITWGTVLEPIAIRHLEQTTQSPCGKLGLKLHDQHQFLGASPDGIQIVKRRPRLVEIKCPQSRQITYKVPLEYWVQVQIAMEVWDIDECLYCEYKFEISDVLPATQDLTVTYGKLARGVYWKYVDSWTYLVKRDRAWFQKIYPQIEQFYRLKFEGTPAFWTLGGTSLQPNDTKTRQQKTQHRQQNIKQKKRKREREEVPIVKKLKTSIAPTIVPVPRRCIPSDGGEADGGDLLTSSLDEEDTNQQPTTTHRHRYECSHLFEEKPMLSIGKVTNFLREDPILDWLSYHYPDHGYEKDKTPFLDFYNQKNFRFKLQVIKQIVDLAEKVGYSYEILNLSVYNLLDIYDQNILLKLQYDCHLIKETKRSQELGMDLIFMGQIGTVIGDRYVWDTVDLLVKRSLFNDLFKMIGSVFGWRSMPVFLVSEESKDFLDNYDYVPIKLKYTTLEHRVGSYLLRGKHRVDSIRFGVLGGGLLLDRKGQFGLVPQLDDDDEENDVAIDAITDVEEGLEWLQDLKTTPFEAVQPNMKNKYDSMWATAKKEIAEERKELTQVNYLSTYNRNLLNNKGIKRLDQLTPEMVEQAKLRYASKIKLAICEDLYLPPLPRNLIDTDRSGGIEVYMDFESCSSLGTGEPIIFLTGIILKGPDGHIEYRPFLVDRLDKPSETAMLTEVMSFLQNLAIDLVKPDGTDARQIPVFHWSCAEPNMLKKAGWSLPSNCFFVDLYLHMIKNKATIPGCYTYGLKSVGNALHQLGKVQSQWLDETGVADGTNAMVMAWNIDHRCRITGEKFNSDRRMRQICEYNYVDCAVMREIRELL